MNGPNDLNSALLLASRAHPALTGLSGTGVAIIVVDYGFDLAHPALCTASGETRFAALIDQNGARLTRADINRLLSAARRKKCRRPIDEIYDPHANYYGRNGVDVGAHGTWVASMAGGSARPDFTGVAPDAQLIGVQLDLPDSAWREEDAAGRPTWIDAARHGPEALLQWNGWRSYENSLAIVSALDEGVERARGLYPDGIVVNLSIGAWAGSHLARSTVNRAIDSITAAGKEDGGPMIAVVTGTGNAGAEQGHVAGRMSSTRSFHFVWEFIPGQLRQCKLEAWADCPAGIEVELVSRSHRQRITFDAVTAGPVAITLEGDRVVGIGHNRGRVRSGLSNVQLLIDPSQVPYFDKGLCAFDVFVRPACSTSIERATVHVWLERDCAGGPAARLKGTCDSVREITENFGKIDPFEGQECCLTSIACAPNVIAVGGLDNAGAGIAAMPISGRGPRPWSFAEDRAGLPSPLLAAPANGLFGARSKTTGYMRGSGTSAAAAIVSGTCALAMQAAVIGRRRLDTSVLVNALLGQSISLNSQTNWRPDVGFGPLCFDPSALLNQQSYPRDLAVSRTEELSDERTLSPPN